MTASLPNPFESPAEEAGDQSVDGRDEQPAAAPKPRAPRAKPASPRPARSSSANKAKTPRRTPASKAPRTTPKASAKPIDPGPPPPLPTDVVVPPKPPLPPVPPLPADLAVAAHGAGSRSSESPSPVDDAPAAAAEADSSEALPVADAPAEPVVEREGEPVVDLGAEAVADAAAVIDAEPEPDPEPVIDVEPEPVVDVEPEPVVDVEPEPVVDVEPEPEPVVDVESEPVVEVAPEPAVEVDQVEADSAADPSDPSEPIDLPESPEDEAIADPEPTDPEVASVDETEPAAGSAPEPAAPEDSVVETEAPSDTSAVDASDELVDEAVITDDDEGALAPAVIVTEPGDSLAFDAESAVPALQLRGVTKVFGDTRAVDGIDLTVPAGSFYGLVGPNGAGKTTTLSMIAGLLRPDAGTITIGGIDVSRKSAATKKLMGVLPDRLRTFDRLTGRQLLYYYGVLRGLPAAVVESRTTDLARAFDLTSALGRSVSDYSAGMTKKVMLAGAMIHSPRLLVLDEPFEAVDPVSSAVILDILSTYVSHGGTVILSSHGMELVERVCSGVAVIVSGQVLAEGTVDQVRGESTLEQRFLELAGGLGDMEGLEWLHTFSD
ncbi:ABC-2 type transport system ATP-binding protein [Microbacterium sp. AG1240]|uniref:ATP-binding cassette domain-containing protein n=1 Tax=Microbacterium sp. AG1240 TaxID=2183992 RepID=UPI000EB348F5|nr:ATP-binding cassette domain-containing protein [Microbacterium sp. AG1240]RKT36597.1 ABC-2 type transport system ATP-binding protein [Microbacterium sp. AG1240]